MTKAVSVMATWKASGCAGSTVSVALRQSAWNSRRPDAVMRYALVSSNPWPTGSWK